MADINVNQLTPVTKVTEDSTYIPLANKETNAGSVILVKDLKTQIANPGFGIGEHNRFRGKDLGTAFTNSQSAIILSGTFDDLYVGDYWIINNVVFRIAGIDCAYNRGDTALTKHHIVVVPESQLYTQQMSHTASGAYEEGTVNSTEGGYANCYGRTTGLANATSLIIGAFGDSHVISYRDYLTTAVSDGQASAGEWKDCKVELMSEMMVYGSCVKCVPSTQEIGIFTFQLPLFAQVPYYINEMRESLWLRSIASDTAFAHVGISGYPAAYHSSSSYGFRPFFLVA